MLQQQPANAATRVRALSSFYFERKLIPMGSEIEVRRDFALWLVGANRAVIMPPLEVKPTPPPPPASAPAVSRK